MKESTVMGGGEVVLLCPIGFMVVLSVMAFFAAFFSRRVAKLCAGAVLFFFSLILLLMLLENRWNIGWVLGLLLTFELPLLLIHGPLILSALAVWAPLRQADIQLPNGRSLPGRPRWRLFLVGLGITVLGIGLGVRWLVERNRGEAKTEALIAGDPSIRLKHFETVHQQRRVVCSDPAVLRYLEERFRNHDPDPQYSGVSYHMWLTFEGGGRQSFSTRWTDNNEINFYIGVPGEGGKGHGLRLVRPRPRGMDEIMSFLLKPDKEVAGQVLHVDRAKTEITFDRSLVVR